MPLQEYAVIAPSHPPRSATKSAITQMISFMRRLLTVRRKRAVSPASSVTSQTPSNSDLNDQLETLDAAVSGLKTDLRGLYFYVAREKRKILSPIWGVKYTDRPSEDPRVIDANQEIALFVGRIAALRPEMGSLHKEVAEKYITACTGFLNFRDVNRMHKYVARTKTRFDAVVDRVDEIVAKENSGWEVALSRARPKIPKPFVIVQRPWTKLQSPPTSRPATPERPAPL